MDSKSPEFPVWRSPSGMGFTVMPSSREDVLSVTYKGDGVSVSDAFVVRVAAEVCMARLDAGLLALAVAVVKSAIDSEKGARIALKRRPSATCSSFESYISVEAIKGEE